MIEERPASQPPAPFAPRRSPRLLAKAEALAQPTPARAPADALTLEQKDDVVVLRQLMGDVDNAPSRDEKIFCVYHLFKFIDTTNRAGRTLFHRVGGRFKTAVLAKMVDIEPELTTILRTSPWTNTHFYSQQLRIIFDNIRTFAREEC